MCLEGKPYYSGPKNTTALATNTLGACDYTHGNKINHNHNVVQANKHQEDPIIILQQPYICQRLHTV